MADLFNKSLKNIDNDILEKIVKRLINIYNPIEIYLYGSYAWGNPGRYSDIDFYIIINESNLNNADRIRLGLSQLTDLNISADLLVYTKDEIENRINHPSTLAYKAINKGIKLYEAA